MITLELLNTHQRRICWLNGPILLGRGAGCDVVLDDPSVSLHHLALVPVRGTLVLRDLNSDAGTWVNGCRVRQCEVIDGDRLRIGRFELILREESEDRPALLAS